MSRKIYVYTGPMYSRKTMRLDAELSKQQIAGMKVVLFRPEFDTRDKKFQNHDGVVLFSGATCVVASSAEVLPICQKEKPQIVGFDEGQFFDRNLALVINELFINHGVLVYYAGLDTDYLGREFETTRDVIGLPEVKLFREKAVCMFCSGTATRTLRITADEKIVTREEGRAERQKLGGIDTYRPTCFSCFSVAMKLGDLTVTDLLVINQQMILDGKKSKPIQWID